ncbi:MAG: histidinol-phosphate transaminase [Rhodobacteraceae bacterium]|nr:histidinol-phosphate transaminase [Paracoccaceae bacterium]
MMKEMLRLRPELAALAPYNAGLTLEEVASRPGVTRIAKLGSNENPYGPSPGVTAAVIAAAQRLHLYPDPLGRDLRAAIAGQLDCRTEQIVLGNGSEDLLNILARSLLRPGDRVVTLYPSFPLHEDYARMMGAEVERIGLTAQGTIDVEALVAAVSRPARLILFSNPMNPAGVWLTPGEMERVVAAQHPESLLCVDEAYIEFADPALCRSAVKLMQTVEKPMMVLRTFSKAWGLAAMRLGYGVTNDAALRRGLDLVRTPFNANHLAQIAGLAALADPTHVRLAVAQIVTERDRVFDAVKALGLRALPSMANFIFFDCGQNAVALAGRLLDQGVIVKPWKQSGYETWMRVTSGLPSENQQFLDAIQRELRR